MFFQFLSSLMVLSSFGGAPEKVFFSEPLVARRFGENVADSEIERGNPAVCLHLGHEKLPYDDLSKPPLKAVSLSEIPETAKMSRDYFWFKWNRFKVNALVKNPNRYYVMPELYELIPISEKEIEFSYWDEIRKVLRNAYDSQYCEMGRRNIVRLAGIPISLFPFLFSDCPNSFWDLLRFETPQNHVRLHSSIHSIFVCGKNQVPSWMLPDADEEMNSLPESCNRPPRLVEAKAEKLSVDQRRFGVGEEASSSFLFFDGERGVLCGEGLRLRP